MKTANKNPSIKEWQWNNRISERRAQFKEQTRNRNRFRKSKPTKKTIEWLISGTKFRVDNKSMATKGGEIRGKEFKNGKLQTIFESRFGFQFRINFFFVQCCTVHTLLTSRRPDMLIAYYATAKCRQRIPTPHSGCVQLIILFRIWGYCLCRVVGTQSKSARLKCMLEIAYWFIARAVSLVEIYASLVLTRISALDLAYIKLKSSCMDINNWVRV